MNNKELMAKAKKCADVDWLMAEIERLNAKLKSMNNELCYKCGRYENAHLGSCDGCRWQIGKDE